MIPALLYTNPEPEPDFGLFIRPVYVGVGVATNAVRGTMYLPVIADWTPVPRPPDDADDTIG